MFYYFGYGSNLSEMALRAKGVRPLSAQPAVLAGWALCFDIPNFFSIEGGTGNIRPAPSEEVHGVLYGCEDQDLVALDELEALNVAYLRKTMTVRTYSGQEHSAYVYIGLPDITSDGLRPSRRYLNILVRGAEDMNLKAHYTERLRRTEVCLKPKYGQFRFPDEPSKLFCREDLAAQPNLTAIAGAVFDMSGARHEHQYLKQLLGGRDVTLFFLRRMDSSDSKESWREIESGSLSPLQRDYLNDYLHQFDHEYRYAGRMNYANTLHRPAQPSLRPERISDLSEIASRRVLRTAEHTNRLLGHENLGFLSASHGFMPLTPPRTELPKEFAEWDQIVAELTLLYRDLKVRRALESIPVLDAGEDELPDRDLLRASAVLSMLAHAYWFCETAPPEALPDAITRPWAEVRRRLDRPDAVLSYIDLIVYNWRIKDPNCADPMHAENLRLLIPTVNNREERIFYLTQTEILARASPILGAVVKAQEGVVQDSPKDVADALLIIIDSLQHIVRKSLLNINPNPSGPTYVNPVVWAKTVAPFAVPMQKGVQGPSGTSSPIFNLLDIFFGRRKNETFLGREIRQLRSGYPFFWREFLGAVAEVSVPEYTARLDDPTLSGLLKDAVEVYAGENGFLGRHRMKVYGYLEQAFKVGRSVTIGGFAGVFHDRTWDQVDSELEYARVERLESFPRGCHYAHVRSVGQTHAGAPDGVKHVVLDVEGSGIRYQPGDRCGILPENSEELVERTLRALEATGDEQMTLTSEWLAAVRLRSGYETATTLPLRELLRFGRIRPVVPRVAEALHAATQNEALLQAVLQQKTTRWELWDVLLLLRERGYDAKRLWQCATESSEHICRVVPPESFRMYSIASVKDSPHREEAKEIELTVGRVRYTETAAGVDQEVQRLGSASDFLARAAGRMKPISFIIDHPARFGLPEDPSVPVVMLAGGTGLSPFRSFILERIRQDAGRCYLFLSLRSYENFYYQDELLHWLSSGILELQIAFSRDDVAVRFEPKERGGRFVPTPSPRRRIHDLLQDDANASLLRKLLKSRAEGGEGAYVYICGRSRFARTVHDAFKSLLMRFHDGTESEREAAADQVLCQMVGEGRYMQEIFTDARTWDVERELLDVSDIIQRNSDESGYWLVIDNLVYDISEFIRQHPGGIHVLKGYAGLDATLGYQRAHHNRSEIDAMREMYEIGQVRPLNFAGITRTIERDGKRQNVALGSLYRTWLSFTYLVVEMQNAVENDQSLQTSATTSAEAPEERTVYKLQRAIETHERFLRSYLDEIIGEPARALWQLTRGMCPSELSVTWMEDRLHEIHVSETARFARSISGALGRRLERLNQLEEPGHPEWTRLRELLDWLFAADEAFLARVKMVLREGMRAFEEHEHLALDNAQERLVKLVASLPDLVEDYYQALVSHCRTGGWVPSEIPAAPSAPPTIGAGELTSLISTEYWLMEEDTSRHLVYLKRHALPIDSIDDLRAQNAAIVQQFRAEYREFGIVVDMRQAPSRNDPEFEDAMGHLRKALSSQFRRVAVLVTSAMGVLQVNRIGRNEGAETFATQSETAARRFAAGG